MKKFILKIVIMFAVALSISALADAQISVRIRPVYTERERPLAPSRNHVWVSGEWNWNHGRYEHSDGYWAQPPSRRNHRYNEGHWKNTRHGFVWVPGGWRR